VARLCRACCSEALVLGRDVQPFATPGVARVIERFARESIRLGLGGRNVIDPSRCSDDNRRIGRQPRAGRPSTAAVRFYFRDDPRIVRASPHPRHSSSLLPDDRLHRHATAIRCVEICEGRSSRHVECSSTRHSVVRGQAPSVCEQVTEHALPGERVSRVDSTNTTTGALPEDPRCGRANYLTRLTCRRMTSPMRTLPIPRSR
jgi:hypothetical protein